MLIKVRTMEVVSAAVVERHAYTVFINPDKIVDVMVNESKGFVTIDVGDSELRHRVSSDEWARIEPMLVGDVNHEMYLRGREHGYDKAFAEGADWQKEQLSVADEPNGEFVPFWMAAHAVEDVMASAEMKTLIRTGKRIDAIRLYRKSRNNFQEAKTVVDIAIKFAFLPADVIDAYRQVAPEQLGTRYARVWLKDLYEAVGKYIPSQDGGL